MLQPVGEDAQSQGLDPGDRLLAGRAISHDPREGSRLGDPSAATAEKGRKLMDIVVERLSTFLVQLAAAPMDEAFPY